MANRLSGLTILGLIGLSLTVGCAPTAPLNHYTLSNLAVQGQRAVEASRSFPQSISLGPLTLAEIVDRPELVVRANAHRVVISETHRWAGPLKTEIARVLADSLAHLLDSRPVLLYPQRGAEQADVRVLVDVQRFESILGKAAMVDAIWTIHWKNGTQETHHAHVQETVADESYDALVAAHNRALLTISQGIASTIRDGGMAAPLR